MTIDINFYQPDLTKVLQSLDFFDGLTQSDSKLMQNIYDSIAITQIARIRANFNNSVDPYGIAWKPFKKTPSAKRGGPTAKLLIDTRTLLGSIRAARIRNGVEIYTDIFYAQYQNNGTNKIPARPFFPDSRGMPEQLSEDIRKIINNAYDKKNSDLKLK